MRMKKATLMTLAAFYAGGVTASTGQASSTMSLPEGLTAVELSAEAWEAAKAPRKRVNRLNPSEITEGNQAGQTNVHRAGARKVPFQWESDLAGEHTYIIQFDEQPVALYQGGVSGFEATSPRSRTRLPLGIASPAQGKVNLHSAEVKAYQQFLGQRQDAHLSAIRSVAGEVQVSNRYQLALNGVAAPMSQQQAAQIASLPGVRSVTRSRNYELLTDSGPGHIGADKVWSLPSANASTTMGEGMLVGIIDTGINTDHPSFAAKAADGYQHTNPLGTGVYKGDCTNEAFISLCNDKLIGVYSYPTITDSYKHPVFQDRFYFEEVDYKRPPNGEDYNSHGSHTASTTAGNVLFDVPFQLGVQQEVSNGRDTNLVFPRISGVAPRANIISYQACFPGDGSYNDPQGDPNAANFVGCPGNVLISAIEDAIADGVDVINFSIGGSESLPWYAPFELAFLAAREAGIHVSASAGNSAYHYIDHVSPWLTSVAATTLDRRIDVTEHYLNGFSGGNGWTHWSDQLQAWGYWPSDFSGAMVLSANSGNELCYENAWAPDTFSADQIVVCKRGDITFAEKVAAVQAAGGGAIVVYNPSYGDPWYDMAQDQSMNHFGFDIPFAMIQSYDGSALVNWLNDGGADHSATLGAGMIFADNNGTADQVAEFSSRGPSRTTPNVMVPNIGAPGVDIFAAYANDQAFTRYPFSKNFGTMSGTSMAAPHVAGAMTLLAQQHPDWTPAELQSAMMTTAHRPMVTGYDGSWNLVTVPTPLNDMGAGVVDVARATAATLVLDETGDNYRAANPAEGGDVSRLNLPYLFNVDCAYTCTWTRTFRATESGTWTVAMEEQVGDGMPMLTLKAFPEQFSIEAGQMQTVQFTAQASDLSALGVSLSDLTIEGQAQIIPLDSSKPTQVLPMRVSYQATGFPPEGAYEIHRSQGSQPTEVLMTRPVNQMAVNGLVKVEPIYLTLPAWDQLSSGIGDPDNIENDPGMHFQFFDVPEGTKRLVLEATTLNATASNDTAIDIGMDLNGDGRIQWTEEALCYSFSYTRDFCAINNPTPGRYWMLVGNYSIYDPNTPDHLENPGKTPMEFDVRLAIITEGDSGDLSTAVIGSSNGIDPYQVELNWDLPELAQGDIYYGAVEMGEHASGDLGTMGLRLAYSEPDLRLNASQNNAKLGDVVEFELVAKPNLTHSDRALTLTATLPEGLNLSTSSVQVQSAMEGEVSIEGNTLNFSGIQPSTANLPRTYQFTTSDEDASCRVPFSDSGYDDNWFDLNYYVMPSTIAGGAWDLYRISPWAFGHPSFELYGQKWNQTIGISPAGYITVGNDPFYMSFGQAPMDKIEFPDTMVAPLWMANGLVEPGYMPNFEVQGVTVAALTTGLIIQWDNVQAREWDCNAFGWCDQVTAGHNSFQLIMNAKNSFAPGVHELIFSYKRLEHDEGTVGTRGYYGFRNPWAPNNGWESDTHAFNDITRTVQPNVAVCGNYSGPEESEVRLRFSAYVARAAAEMVVEASSQYDGGGTLKTHHTLGSNGTIKLGHFADATIEENSSLKSVAVIFDAATQSDKVISVNGDYISATVHGHTSGSLVDITPDTHWFGTTEVTITVADASNPSDSASASFMLEVISDGESAPTPEPEPEPEAPKRDSGSLGYFALMLLALLPLRRRLNS
ncbi:S8 family serine peptidase [Ferrimonas balearica]|uniref:S8 family serine peptidase n=1 Tax=Ferrimonas balearica TaxID=44012 RepID=UPI001C997FEE|nr:S8 family serine peptidase [Ferrimonas balearica]MBY5921193.1 S8 family serine peptidase [Ferrimonas balearica]MBY5996122.1 S8 family serine peptidase [Ferrimonas balearica]